MTVIDLGTVQLDYERRGEGPPLLLIMGMSGTALHWGEPFLELLRRNFDVIAYDHRGVGASSRLNGSVTIGQMAEDASGLLSALGIESAHVLGISMGGMVAQELALAHPEQIRTLILGCTYCGGDGSSLVSPEILQRLTSAMMSGDRERALRTAFEVNVAAERADDDQLFRSFLEIGNRRAVAIGVVMAQMQACAAHLTYDRLPALHVSTLVIHGSGDQMLASENGRILASRIADAELEVLDGVGHLFFWEQPERAAELVRAHAAVPA